MRQIRRFTLSEGDARAVAERLGLDVARLCAGRRRQRRRRRCLVAAGLAMLGLVLGMALGAVPTDLFLSFLSTQEHDDEMH
ncbi:hypothetical protein HH299_07320, partial [Xanthomonas sp. Kuri4-2]